MLAYGIDEYAGVNKVMAHEMNSRRRTLGWSLLAAKQSTVQMYREMAKLLERRGIKICELSDADLAAIAAYDITDSEKFADFAILLGGYEATKRRMEIYRQLLDLIDEAAVQSRKNYRNDVAVTNVGGSKKMNKELTLLPICWADEEKRRKAKANEQRMAAALDEAHREELRRREHCDKIFDCFIMGAAGAMTACVVITALGLC